MICRSAITGRFCSKTYAKRYPHLTVCETSGNLHKRALPKGHRLIKRHKPFTRNGRARG